MKHVSDAYIHWPAGCDDLIRVMYWVGSQPVQTHKHEYIEIAFIAKGTCLHQYHGTIVRLIPGDIFVITPHEEHSYEINTETVIYNCLFYPEVLGEDWTAIQKIKGVYDLLIVEPFYRIESRSQEILHLSPDEAACMEALLKKIMGEAHQQREGYRLMMKSDLITFLCLLGRAWDNQFKDNKTLYSNKRNLLADAMNFIEENLKDPIRIEELAAKAYFSPNYFRKVFKEVTGLAPLDYINQLRITRAKQLLAEENMSVADVGEAVGIQDLNYFSRLFKSVSGLTPSEFKRKNKPIDSTTV